MLERPAREVGRNARFKTIEEPVDGRRRSAVDRLVQSVSRLVINAAVPPPTAAIIINRKGMVHAVTGIRDVHVVPADERTKVFSRESLYLDVGAHNAADVETLGIGPGDPVPDKV